MDRILEWYQTSIRSKPITFPTLYITVLTLLLKCLDRLHVWYSASTIRKIGATVELLATPAIGSYFHLSATFGTVHNKKNRQCTG